MLRETEIKENKARMQICLQLSRNVSLILNLVFSASVFSLWQVFPLEVTSFATKEPAVMVDYTFSLRRCRLAVLMAETSKYNVYKRTDELSVGVPLWGGLSWLVRASLWNRTDCRWEQKQDLTYQLPCLHRSMWSNPLPAPAAKPVPRPCPGLQLSCQANNS